jgi:hypothetical protein
MQSISLHRSVSKLIAGALFAALCAFVVGPASAQPVWSMEKSPDGGTLTPGQTASFTITVTNTGDQGFAHLTDALPVFPGSDWSIVSEDPLFGCQGLDPGPGQQTLVCDLNLGGITGETTISVVLESPTPEGGCLVLNNTAFLSEDEFSPPFLSDDGDISVGFCEGRMTGGGSIFLTSANKGKGSKAVRITHGFELRCDPSDSRQNLEINWPGDANQNNFHLTSMVAAQCTDDPAIVPHPPRVGFDTYIGSGLGTCNGQPAAISFVFTDAGEPGTKDTAEYHISGACTLDTPKTNLDKGNQQAHAN